MGGFSVSATGVLAYSRGLTTLSRLTRFDREGKSLGAVTELGDYVNFRLSPDNKRLAVSKIDPVLNNTDLWLIDLPGGLPARFTADPASDTAPIWSPDGSRIVFRSDRAGFNRLFERPANGTEPEKPMGSANQIAFPTDWSPDSKTILFYTPFSPLTGSFDVLTIKVPGDEAPVPIARTPFADIDGRFSPDGRWVAYASDDSGKMEVYVQAFPQAGNRRRVSSGGGSEPRWRRDGGELFYLAADGKLMAVPVRLTPSFEPGTPRPLFQTQTAFVGSPYRMNYDVGGDPPRFLVNLVTDAAASSTITIVLNWPATLRK